MLKDVALDTFELSGDVCLEQEVSNVLFCIKFLTNYYVSKRNGGVFVMTLMVGIDLRPAVHQTDVQSSGT